MIQDDFGIIVYLIISIPLLAWGFNYALGDYVKEKFFRRNKECIKKS